MEKRKYFAVAASAAVALSAVFSPLTMYAQDEEVNLEEELDEDITSHAEENNEPDEEDVFSSELGRVEIKNYEGELPEKLQVNIAEVDVDKDQNPDPGNESKGYTVQLLDEEENEFIPEGKEVEYTVRLQIPDGTKPSQLRLFGLENLKDGSDNPVTEKIDFDFDDDKSELVFVTDHLDQTFVLTNYLTGTLPQEPVLPSSPDAPNSAPEGNRPEDAPDIDECDGIYESENGDIRVKHYSHNFTSDMNVVYEYPEDEEIDSIMEKAGIEDFKALNVRLLDKEGKDFLNSRSYDYYFRVPLPTAYEDREISVYRIYEPGIYDIWREGKYESVEHETRFAVEINSSVNWANKTVHWEGNALGLYVLAAGKDTEGKKISASREEDKINCQTQNGEILIENFTSELPSGFYADLKVEPRTSYSTAFKVDLFDEWNTNYVLKDKEAKYTIKIPVPEKFRGHELRLAMESRNNFSSGGPNIVDGNRHTLVDYELSPDGKELIMHPTRLDKTFLLTDTKLKSEADQGKTDHSPDSNGTGGNKKPITGSDTHVTTTTKRDFITAGKLGGVRISNIGSGFSDEAFVLVEEAEKSYEPHKDKKSVSVAVKLLDNDNKEYLVKDKGIGYSVSLTTPQDFLGHTLRIDMIEPAPTASNPNGVKYTPINYTKEKGGRTLTFSPSSLNKIFVITDMDSKADSKPSGPTNTGTTTSRPNTNTTVTTNTNKVFYGIDGGYIRVSSPANQPPQGLKFSYESKTGSKFSSAMKENGITEFKAYDVRLLDAAGKDYKTDEKNPRYEFNMPLPESYKKRDVGIYRIYEPGTYTFGSAGQYTTITSSTSFAREIGSSVNRVDDTIHWEADQLGTYILADKGETNDLYPTVAKDDKGITYGTNAGEIRIEGFSSEPPEGVHASLVKLKETTDAKAGEKSAFYSIKLLSERNRTFVPNGKDLKYTVRLKLPADFIDHDLRLATEETKEYGSGASAYSTTTYTPVKFVYSSDKTEIIFEPESLDKTFVLTDEEAKVEDKKNPENESDEKSGSGSGDSGTTTTTTNNTTTRTTTQRTSSPNTGLHQRFGFWFAGLFASTAGLAVLLKKKRQDD